MSQTEKTENRASDCRRMHWKKKISLELIYDELDKSIENLWSVLFTTGYLTHQGTYRKAGKIPPDYSKTGEI